MGHKRMDKETIVIQAVIWLYLEARPVTKAEGDAHVYWELPCSARSILKDRGIYNYERIVSFLTREGFLLRPDLLKPVVDPDEWVGPPVYIYGREVRMPRAYKAAFDLLPELARSVEIGGRSELRIVNPAGKFRQKGIFRDIDQAQEAVQSFDTLGVLSYSFGREGGDERMIYTYRFSPEAHSRLQTRVFETPTINIGDWFLHRIESLRDQLERYVERDQRFDLIEAAFGEFASRPLEWLDPFWGEAHFLLAYLLKSKLDRVSTGEVDIFSC